MENNMNISNLERLDTKTSWAWDFKVDGFNFWMTAVKDAEGMWNFTTIYDGDVLSKDYDTKKWGGWEKRMVYVKPFLGITDTLNLPSVAVEKAKKKVAKVKQKISGLNANEQMVLKELYHNAMDCTSGEFGFTDEIMRELLFIKSYATELSKPQIKGYIGSLAKKELIWIDSDESSNQFGFTDKGWKVLQDLNLTIYEKP